MHARMTSGHLRSSALWAVPLVIAMWACGPTHAGGNEASAGSSSAAAGSDGSADPDNPAEGSAGASSSLSGDAGAVVAPIDGAAGTGTDPQIGEGTAGTGTDPQTSEGAAGTGIDPETGEGGAGNTATIAEAGAAPVDVGGDPDNWFLESTISRRNLLPVPGSTDVLGAAPILEQLEIYDPGSLLRCEVNDDPAYREVVDSLGGVTWGYAVRILEDESKPIFQAGFPDYSRMAVGATNDASGGSAVEIEEADIIGLSATSALYYSQEHGLLMVDLSGAEPAFLCATKLPGRVSKFFFYEGHLVIMTEQITGTARHSYLLHFDVTSGALSFVEAIDLGAVRILDTRRFNERLVVYTDLTLEDQQPVDAQGTSPVYYEARGLHRSLRVFQFGDTLTEEMTDTLLDTSPNTSYLTDGGIDPATPVGSLVYESSNFGQLMWASDHYFVVTEELRRTTLTSWETRTYSVCTESHTVDVPYTYCQTVYEERPNPDYVPPDNSGGDRACNGLTLSDCLRQVSRASNPTIQVPVGRECEQRVRTHWICDARESRSYTYPNLGTETATRLYIYEYTADGFIRLDTQVSEITTAGLEQQTDDPA